MTSDTTRNRGDISTKLDIAVAQQRRLAASWLPPLSTSELQEQASLDEETLQKEKQIWVPEESEY